MELTKEQAELIEEFGVKLEKSGLAPAQARIAALLLICEEGEMTFDEIYQTLKISKSAASNAINHMMMTNKIHYHTKPGDRKRYFTSRISQMELDFEKNYSKFLEINSYLKRILALRSDKNLQFNEKLKNLISFMEYLNEELPIIYQKWKERKTNHE